MTDRAHIRGGQIVASYSGEKGWLTLEGGDKVSPVVIGFANGNDRVVAITRQTVDNSTGPDVVKETATDVSDSGVTITTTIRDKTQAEIDAQQTAEIDAALDAVQKNRSGLKALAEGLFIAYNEAREAGGKAAITKQQYLTWLRGRL